MKALSLVLAGLVATTTAAAPKPPVTAAGRLLPGYDRLATVELVVRGPNRRFEIVALRRTDEDAARNRSVPAPARPLLILERRGARLVPIGRNDHVVLRADEGGQCDPFLDGRARIAVRGLFFTVENGVACGQHWTNYVTFRWDAAAGFVFDNERSESWVMNMSDAPTAEGLVRDGPQHVVRAKPGRPISFSAWRRQR